jgi:hypothetical protein
MGIVFIVDGYRMVSEKQALKKKEKWPLFSNREYFWQPTTLQ